MRFLKKKKKKEKRKQKGQGINPDNRGERGGYHGKTTTKIILHSSHVPKGVETEDT
jgi:hypothetical protein